MSMPFASSATILLPLIVQLMLFPILRQGAVTATRQAALAAICQAAAAVPQEATTRLLTVHLPTTANPQPHRIQSRIAGWSAVIGIAAA